MQGPDGREIPDYGNLNAPHTLVCWMTQGSTLHLVFVDAEMFESICNAFNTESPPPNEVIAHARYVYSMPVAGALTFIHSLVDRMEMLMSAGAEWMSEIQDPPPYLQGTRKRIMEGGEPPHADLATPDSPPVEDILPRQVPQSLLWRQIGEVLGDDAHSDQ